MVHGVLLLETDGRTRKTRKARRRRRLQQQEDLDRVPGHVSLRHARLALESLGGLSVRPSIQISTVDAPIPNEDCQ